MARQFVLFCGVLLAALLAAATPHAPAPAQAAAAPQAQAPAAPVRTTSLPPSPKAALPAACPVGGLSMHVPWALGGPRIEPDGRLVEHRGDWPDLPVTGLRLWDTRTAWLNLEPADDQWQFAHLDALLAKARSEGVTRITLVLGGTPRWAAARVAPTDAPWLGPGSASPPRDLRSWQQYVGLIAARYAGQINTYEILNEPLSPAFFNGTPAEWAQLVTVAAREIHTHDPAADIVASGFILHSHSDLVDTRPWLAALARESGGELPLTGLSIHWYPNSWSAIAGLGRLAARFRAEAATLGLPRRIIVTEANALATRGFPGPHTARAVTGLMAQARLADIDELTWYAWLDLPSPTMPLHTGTPAALTLQHCNNRARP